MMHSMARTSSKSLRKRTVAPRVGGALRRKASARTRAVLLSTEEIARRVEPYCRAQGIIRLDVFGSIARGDARPGSDVDLIATFREIPGLRFFGMESELARLLGRPVDLLLAEDVEEMTNPHRRATIQRDRRTIYAAYA
jgi:predicted nucleotidyltransferase